MRSETAAFGAPRLAALRLRAQLYAVVREFFAARAVLEVETPILSQAANTDPNIQSFRTAFAGPDAAGSATRWLRTSPEFPLKRLLAAGIGDCYELGRVFRNGEAGRRHNPEFTLLEWYRLGIDHRRLMDEVAELVGLALRLTGKTARVVKSSYAGLFQTEFGFDPHHAPREQLNAAVRPFVHDPAGFERDALLDLLLTHALQPKMPADQLLLLYDYPASQCALARIRTDATPVAERFEVYLGSHELANGYHELTDATEQRRRFEHDNTRRVARGDAALPVDENLLAALDRGLPDCSGVALGIERLLMYLSDASDIREVVAYPFAEA